jgi:lipoyl(octanoyl) transferase
LNAASRGSGGRPRERGLAAAPAGGPGRGRSLEARWLGQVAYADALERQEELVRLRRDGRVPDQLLLLEHSHVITLGTAARAEHVLLEPAERSLLGVELFETGRGGDVTYHGPGQLVGYPVLDLKPDRRDVHAYVRRLEEVLIRAAGEWGIRGERRAGFSGVWVGDEKIAAIGVRVSSGWITSHGFALNVSTDLRWFEGIVPCGIRDRGVTSVARLAGNAPSLEAAAGVVGRQFRIVFDYDPGEPGSSGGAHSWKSR